MTNQPPIRLPVPNLSNVKAQPPLIEFIVLVESDDDVVSRTYKAQGYNVDQPGNLHLVRGQQVVASLAAGVWLEVHRADYAPEEEQVLRHGYGPQD